MLRRISPVVLAAASVLLLASCSAPGDGDKQAPAGEVVTFQHPSLDEVKIDFTGQPEKVVMDCYAYSSLQEYDVKPVALFGYDCDNPFVMGDVDVKDIPKVGTDGEINVEKLAELKPDAIIGHGGAQGWSWFDEDVNKQITRVAPFVPLPGKESIDKQIADVREIAAFFGGDTTSDAVKKSDADLETAKKTFGEAAKGSDLNIMLASPSKEMLYTAVGFAQADLLEDAGATIIGAEAPKQGNPWGQVAWESAASYPADVIFIEGYDDSWSFDNELWQALPAVKAKQLGSWGSKGAMTATNYAAWLNNAAELVKSSSKVA